MPSKKAKCITEQALREQLQRHTQIVIKAYDAIVSDSPRIGDAELLAALGDRCWDGLFPLSPRQIIDALDNGEGLYRREAQKLRRRLASNKT